MALDPSIITQIQPQAESGVQPIQLANQIADLQAQRAQRQAAAENALAQAQARVEAARQQGVTRAALQAAGGDAPTAVTALRARGEAQAADALEENYGKAKKATYEAIGAHLDQQTKAFDFGGRLLDGLEADPTPTNLALTRSALLAMPGSDDPAIKAFINGKLPDTLTPDQIGDAAKQFRVSLQPQKDYLDAQATLHRDWNTPQRIGAFANALALTPDQTSKGADGSAVLGKMDLIKFAEGQGLDKATADAARALVQSGATPDQIRTQLGMSPTEQSTAALAAVRDANTARHERVLESAELSNAAVNRAREAREGAAAQGDAISSAAMNPNGPHGDDYLKSLPADEANMVKALAEGRIPFPTGTALRSPLWSQRIGEVFNYDPSFDSAQASNNARQKVRNDFTSGKSAQQVNALNTVIGHLSHLADLGDKLNNSPLDFANAAMNYLTPGGSTRGATINSFNLAKQAVASELTRVYRQAGGSEKDIESWQASINAAKSPSELADAWRTIGGLLESKLGALQDQYQQGMGRTPVNVVTPEARATLNRLQGVKSDSVASTRTLSYNGQSFAVTKQPDGTWKSATGGVYDDTGKRIR